MILGSMKQGWKERTFHELLGLEEEMESVWQKLQQLQETGTMGTAIEAIDEAAYDIQHNIPRS